MSVSIQKPAPPRKGEDPTPTYNNFVRSTLGKGESLNYTDQLQGLALLKAYDDKQADVVQRLLSRLLQYGHFDIAGVQLALEVLHVDIKSKDERALTRLVHYLVHLGLGDGSAGTPLPVPVASAGLVLAKAVDRLGLEQLVAAWADLGDEKAAFTRKAAALRALAAVTRASLTSKPEDATYVQGLYETCRGLLDKMDSLRAERRGLKAALAAHGQKRGKNLLADYRQRAEMWGLMRGAFSAARVALPRSGLYKIASRSLSALGSSDPVCARHALALASLVARDRTGAGAFIAAVEPLLTTNVEAAKRTGSLHLGILPVKRGGGSATDGSGADGGGEETHLCLRDTWARVYLARACAAVIQSAHIAGDVQGRGAVFWQALLLLALSDPSELVAQEATRAMFGALPPRATTATALRQQGGARLPGSTPAEVESDLAQSKIYGASWHMIMSQALEPPPGPAEPSAAGADTPAPPAAPGGLITSPSRGAPPTANGVSASGEETSSSSGMFDRITRRLVRCLLSGSHSLVCAAARTVGVMAEARAWFHALSGGHGHEAEPEAVRRAMRSLHGWLLMLSGDDGVSGCGRAAAIEALIWMQGIDQPPSLTPGHMLRAASAGGFTAPPIVRFTFADPWPDGLAVETLGALSRRLRCSVGFPPELVLELAGGLAAGSPCGVPRDALQALWDAAPGPLAARAALSLLSAPLPPLCCPVATAAVEVKALACSAEAAYTALKAMAACWLGEHVNSVAGEYAWKPWEHKMGPAAEAGPGLLESVPSTASNATAGGALATRGSVAPPGGRTARSGTAGAGPSAAGGGAEVAAQVAVAGVSHNPLLAAAITHLHRAMLMGTPTLRVAAAQALAKIAVRSGEPYRIQCYSLLAAASALGAAGPAVRGAAGGGAGQGVAAGVGVGAHDPLGLAPVVAPALEVLDAMYAGELVLERHVSQYGTRARGWPAPALESLRRRHEWLLGAIACAVCAVPKELFLPLGPRSRRLLFPDEKEEAEEEAAAAAAAQAAEQAYGEGEQQYDEYGQPYQYDYGEAEAYDYGDYYAQQEGAAAEDPYAQEDPLARYDFSGQKAAAAVELNWGGAAGAAEDGAEASADMLADARPGVMLYAFNAENADEVSVAAGEHVRVLHDLGEWFHVAASSSGQHGLVPASYVQLADDGHHHGAGGGDGGGPLLSPSSSVGLGGSMRREEGASAGGAAYGRQASGRPSLGGAGASQDPSYFQYDNPEYDAGNNGGAYGSYYGGDYGGQYGGDQYGGGAYGSSAYGGGAYEESSAAGGERGLGKKKGFGGFDDFGAVLAAAKTAAQSAVRQVATTVQDATNNRTPAPAAHNDGGATQPSRSDPSDYSTPIPASAPSYSESFAPYTNELAPGVTAGAQEQPAAAASEYGGEAAGERTAVAMYEFVAEMDGELSVAAGESLVVGEEQDGWYMARVVSDGRMGLIPASYVQLG